MDFHKSPENNTEEVDHTAYDNQAEEDMDLICDENTQAEVDSSKELWSNRSLDDNASVEVRDTVN